MKEEQGMETTYGDKRNMEDKTGTGKIEKRSGRDDRINKKRRERNIKRKGTMVGKERGRIWEGKDVRK